MTWKQIIFSLPVFCTLTPYAFAARLERTVRLFEVRERSQREASLSFDNQNHRPFSLRIETTTTSVDLEPVVMRQLLNWWNATPELPKRALVPLHLLGNFASSVGARERPWIGDVRRLGEVLGIGVLIQPAAGDRPVEALRVFAKVRLLHEPARTRWVPIETLESNISERAQSFAIVDDGRIEPIVFLREPKGFWRPHGAQSFWVVKNRELEQALADRRTAPPDIELLRVRLADLFSLTPPLYEIATRHRRGFRLAAPPLQARPANSIAITIRMPWAISRPTREEKRELLFRELAQALSWKLNEDRLFPSELVYDTSSLFNNYRPTQRAAELKKSIEQAPNRRVRRELLRHALTRSTTAEEFVYLALPTAFSRAIDVHAQQVSAQIDRFFNCGGSVGLAAYLSSYLPLSARARERLIQRFENELIQNPALLTEFFVARFPNLRTYDRSRHHESARQLFDRSFQTAHWTKAQLTHFADRSFYDPLWTYFVLGRLLAIPGHEEAANKYFQSRNPGTEEWQGLALGAPENHRSTVDFFLTNSGSFSETVRREGGAHSLWITEALKFWMERATDAGCSADVLFEIAIRLIPDGNNRPWILIGVLEGLKRSPAAQSSLLNKEWGRLFGFPPQFEWAPNLKAQVLRAAVGEKEFEALIRAMADRSQVDHLYEEAARRGVRVRPYSTLMASDDPSSTSTCDEHLRAESENVRRPPA